jgi:predicted RNase H-like HicB family nuclease
VDDVEFSMPENIINERFSNRWFVIYYLPHYKFILDYKILTEEETRKKLQMLKYDLCYCTDEGRLVNKKVGLTMDKSKWKYPALIRQEKDGDFGVYFPTLFSGVGWHYPLSRGNTKEKAIEKAKKDLAYTIAGIIYDNDVVPEPVMIPTEQLSEDMEIIEIETCYEDYKKEIEEHLLGRHWHIDYWDEEFGVISTFGFRNEQGTWNIYFSEHTSDDKAKFLDKHYKRTSNSSNEWLLFTVKSRSEAEEKVYNFIENVLLPIRRVNK